MKKILKYIKKELFYLILSLIISIIVVFLTIFIPFKFGEIIDIVCSFNQNINILTNKMIFVAILIFCTALFQWLFTLINTILTFKITKRLSIDLFVKIHKLPLKYIDKKQTGELISVMVSDVDTIGSGLLLGFNQLFIGVFTILGTIIFMLYINWLIALMVVVLSPLSLFVAKFIANKSYTTFKTQSLVRAKQTAFIEENVTNVKIVKTFNYQRVVKERFEKINDELKKCSFKATFYSSLTNPCTRFVNSVVYALVALVGAFFIINESIFIGFTIGGLTCLLSYANQYTKPFNEISSVINELQNAIACSERVFDLLEQEEESNALEEHVLEKIDGNVDFEHVSFSYDSTKKLIEDLNLSIKPGMKVAIVGPTGCGKTTLINLLMRFYDVNVGNICVDKINTKTIFKRSLRDSFGMVLQETWIKNASILENIRLGKEDATLDEVIEACKKAHAHSFIKRLPDGYNTIVGENYNLSQGQKQLICISRVMLCMPPMLILDEATSSIDTNTERKIQDAFNLVMKGKTSFIVAHRLSTIINADLILVMKDGNIIEKGTHHDLLKKRGFYCELYNSQFIK